KYRASAASSKRCAGSTGTSSAIPAICGPLSSTASAKTLPRAIKRWPVSVSARSSATTVWRYLVLGNAGAIQPSLRKSATATAPYVKVVRALKKLRGGPDNADDRLDLC